MLEFSTLYIGSMQNSTNLDEIGVITMKKYRKVGKPIEAIQWKPGVKIPGVVETSELYPRFASNPAEAIYVDTDGGNILISEGDWLVFKNGAFSKPEKVLNSFFEKDFEMVSE